MLCLVAKKTWEIGFLSSLVLFIYFLDKERMDRWVVVAVVLNCGFGMWTIILDVFCSQET